MPAISSNLRKAAVMIRSLDADSAALLLAQLSPSEAAAVREAIRALDGIDSEEQENIVTELRRAAHGSELGVTAKVQDSFGVELQLSSDANFEQPTPPSPTTIQSGPSKRFQFLESTPVATIVSQLSREHAQTIAVVLSHIAPARAADVLAALPQKLQADAIERMAALGETDAESVTTLERELAAWFSQRHGDRASRGRRQEAIAAILAATNGKTRDGLLANLRVHKSQLAEQLGAIASPGTRQSTAHSRTPRPKVTLDIPLTNDKVGMEPVVRRPSPAVPAATRAPRAPRPRIEFDQLIHLDDPTLSAVMREVNPQALALALAGATEKLVDRICKQMPKRTAKAFRRKLGQWGPTRLRDVEAAQYIVTQVASQYIAASQARSVA